MFLPWPLNCPPPRTPDEQFVWVTDEAIREIEHAVAAAEPSRFTPDLFPFESATVIFQTPVSIGPNMPLGGCRWVNDKSGEGVMFTIARPWMFGDDIDNFTIGVAYGDLCKPASMSVNAAPADRLLWALLQLSETPLAHRPKAERSEIRRADKRTRGRGREETAGIMRVIDLRRPEPGESVPTSERHVRAHWAAGHMRRQWHPSTEQHIPTWISTHVRGNPELGWAPTRARLLRAAAASGGVAHERHQRHLNGITQQAGCSANWRPVVRPALALAALR